MKRWIGTDESGKGDYFGGLVVAGVVVDEVLAQKLAELGVRDSKKLSDSKAELLSESISSLCLNSIVSIGPQKYNELYSKLHNLNHILAWAHARVIENLLAESNCELVIADKFGDKKYIEKALMEKGKKIRLEQRERAENDPAVAAASILARNRFVKELNRLGSTVCGAVLPKGAGPEVEKVAQDLVNKHGESMLIQIATLRFRTTNKITLHQNVGPGLVPGQKNKLDRLWAPWRAKFIYSPPQEDKCIFCDAINKPDKDGRVLYRGANAFVVMNIFPYNNGHLMVAPYRHTGNIEELTQEESAALFELVQKSVAVLKSKLNPQGFNIGINLGKVAGAGVADHIHIHIVPRWQGDTNFMPVISNTKVLAQSLEELYKLLKKGFE